MPENDNPAVCPVSDDPDELRRRVEEPELENALMREVVDVAEERFGRRSETPFGPAEDSARRSASLDVFTNLFGPQAQDLLE